MSGTLHVVGLGPGDPGWLAPKAREILEKAGCIAGYPLYLDLVPEELRAGKIVLKSGMGQERERCRQSLDAALSGVDVALVCSGDPGIYALASLVLEIMEKEGCIGKVPFAVAPGIPALCAGAALLGAPLCHDFACVSLSDLLTPFSLIEKRLEAVFMADFVCVLYNPRSKGRPDNLGRALALAARYRKPDTPVGLVKNASRDGSQTITATLGEFDANLADMLSIIFVGNSETRFTGPYMLTPRGYIAKYESKNVTK